VNVVTKSGTMVFMGAPLNFCGTRLSTPRTIFLPIGPSSIKTSSAAPWAGRSRRTDYFFFVTIKEHEREKASIRPDFRSLVADRTGNLFDQGGSFTKIETVTVNG